MQDTCGCLFKRQLMIPPGEKRIKLSRVSTAHVIHSHLCQPHACAFPLALLLWIDVTQASVLAVIVLSSARGACPLLLIMEAQHLQAAFARMLAGQTVAAQGQGNVWQGVPGFGPAAASSSTGSSAPSMCGYPGTGIFAGQTPAEAAQLYAQMLQLSEQRRLILQAEAQTAATASTAQEDPMKKLREMIRQEVAAAAAVRGIQSRCPVQGSADQADSA